MILRLSILLDSENIKFAHFARAEFAARYERARAFMEKQELDALLLVNDNNCTYFSGYRKPWPYYRTFLILPKDVDPTFIIANKQRGNAEETSWFYPDHVAVYGEKTSDHLNLLLRTIREAGLKNAHVGADLASVPVDLSIGDFETLKREFPNLKFSDASDLMWKLRMVKTEKEIEYVRKSCQITCKAFRAGLESIRAGMTESDLSGIVRSDALRQGAEDARITLRSGKERYRIRDPYPRGKRLERGDIVTIDGGSVYRGYFSDIYRVASVGEPSTKQVKLHKNALRAQAAAIKALKPGVKVKDVTKSSVRIAIEAHNSGYSMHSPWIGHGLGMDIHEPPDFTLHSEAILQPRMIVAIEIAIWPIEVIEWYRGCLQVAGKVVGEGIFAVEDDVLITEKNNEILTSLERDLWIAH